MIHMLSIPFSKIKEKKGNSFGKRLYEDLQS